MNTAAIVCRRNLGGFFFFLLRSSCHVIVIISVHEHTIQSRVLVPKGRCSEAAGWAEYRIQYNIGCRGDDLTRRSEYPRVQ